MALTIPFPRNQKMQYNFSGRPAATMGTLVTAATGLHTLGATHTEVMTTTIDCFWMRIILHNTQQAGIRTDGLLNLYIGSAGSERLLINNLLAGWTVDNNAGFGPPRVYEFPLYLPSGTRISARYQALIASDTCNVSLMIHGGGRPGNWWGTGVETLGTVATSSIGTSVTPSATGGQGTFTAIGTTTKEYKYVFPMYQGSLADTTMTSTWEVGDIGTGGNVLNDLTDFQFGPTSNEFTFNFPGNGRFTLIPASTALQIRSAISGSTAEAKDWAIYGVY